MPTDSLIGKLQSLDGGTFKGFPLQAYMQAVAECIDIIRQHEAEKKSAKVPCDCDDGIDWSSGQAVTCLDCGGSGELPADHPHAQALNISPERVQKVERIERVKDPKDVVGRVERVARAICAADGKDDPDSPYILSSGEPTGEKLWELWIPEAKAAIAAMGDGSIGNDAVGGPAGHITHLTDTSNLERKEQVRRVWKKEAEFAVMGGQVLSADEEMEIIIKAWEESGSRRETWFYESLFEDACKQMEKKYQKTDENARFHDVGALRGYLYNFLLFYISTLPKREISALRLREEFVKRTHAVPLGTEDKQRGASSYNWGRHHIAVIDEILAEMNLIEGQ
jgi:hypothetical protein